MTDYSQALTFNYHRAEQVPEQCLSAVKLLDSQPLFDGRGSITKSSKVIHLDSWDDARIFEIFNDNASKFTNRDYKWYIHSFGCGNHQLYDHDGKHIRRGLELWLYSDREMCSIYELGQAYADVYKSMSKNWVESNIDDYPDIMFKNDPDEFILYVKKSLLSGEDTLIRFLASKFGLGEYVKCYSEWLSNNLAYHYTDSIYMWIDKERLSEVIDVFGFEL